MVTNERTNERTPTDRTSFGGDAPHRKPCQQSTFGYVRTRATYVHLKKVSEAKTNTSLI